MTPRLLFHEYSPPVSFLDASGRSCLKTSGKLHFTSGGPVGERETAARQLLGIGSMPPRPGYVRYSLDVRAELFSGEIRYDIVDVQETRKDKAGG